MAIEDQPPIYILVRGLLGAFMPGHFKRVMKDICSPQVKCIIAPTSPIGTISENAKRISRVLPNMIQSTDRIIFLAHSKGGIETLAALMMNPDLQKNTCAAILFQTPKRGAPYLKSLFRPEITKTRSQIIKEGIHKFALTTVLAEKACRELATDDVLPFVKEIENKDFNFPVYSYSTFSTQNSGWIELQSNRISELNPGKPNDGVFLTEDQIWPQFFHREIAEIDHAEPTVGSPRINEVHLWRKLLEENRIAPQALAHSNGSSTC
jgi:hypothetical protein